MKRPWKAFVHSIGPIYSFATKEAAEARAAKLTQDPEGERYATVSVFNAFADAPGEMTRTLYRYDRPEPVVQRLDFGKAAWVDVQGDS